MKVIWVGDWWEMVVSFPTVPSPLGFRPRALSLLQYIKKQLKIINSLLFPPFPIRALSSCGWLRMRVRVPLTPPGPHTFGWNNGHVQLAVASTRCRNPFWGGATDGARTGQGVVGVAYNITYLQYDLRPRCH